LSSKSGVIGKKSVRAEVETAQVIPSTIIETVSATGKTLEIEVKISSEVSRNHINVKKAK
jgi:HlyD family secretion protein